MHTVRLYNQREVYELTDEQLADLRRIIPAIAELRERMLTLQYLDTIPINHPIRSVGIELKALLANPVRVVDGPLDDPPREAVIELS
jgi:hypothetical protein